MDGDREGERRRLPRRDLIILPLLALVTLACVLGGAEVIARLVYPSAEADACYLPNAPAGAPRYRANCTARIKVAEGPWTVARYNACGFRTPEACGPKPDHTLRVAVIGSSTAAGYLVDYDESFAGRASRALTRACGEPVEFQNLGGAGYNGPPVIPRADAALALQPDAMVMIVTVVDLELADTAAAAAAPAAAPTSPKGLLSRLKAAVWTSRALYMEQYFLLNNDETYLPFYLKLGAKAGFMQDPMTPEWRRRVVDMDRVLATVADKARAKGVPFIVIFAPQRAQAAMAASAKPWPGFDPYAMPKALAPDAVAHGAQFIDATRAIPKGAASKSLFYTVNGHMNAAGHKILSDILVSQLAAAPGTAFAACRAPG